VKIIISYIFLFLLLNNAAAQFNWYRIFSNQLFGIETASSVEYKFVNNKKIIFRLNPGYYNSVGSNYYALEKNALSVFIPFNSFINGHWVYWVVGGNSGQSYKDVSAYQISPFDSNFVIRCKNEAANYQVFYTTKITYNGGDSSVQVIVVPNGISITSFLISNFSDSVLFAVDANKTLYKSTDRGINWDLINVIPSLSNGSLKYNKYRDGSFFIFGSSLYMSTNNGASFINLNLNNISDIAFSPTDSSIWAFNNYDIYKSTNFGLNWTFINSLFGVSSLEINPDNHLDVYIGSVNGLNRSIDGGYNINVYNNTFSPSRRVIHICKDKNSGDTVWVVTEEAIYKVWGSYVLPVNMISAKIPDDYKLFQNYPNPFNPLTTIGFQCSEFKEVSLKVYDILGREIAVLVNEPLAPGMYEVKFDGSRISSGMYFYRLHTNNYTETKKMSLLK